MTRLPLRRTGASQSRQRVRVNPLIRGAAGSSAVPRCREGRPRSDRIVRAIASRVHGRTRRGSSDADRVFWVCWASAAASGEAGGGGVVLHDGFLGELKPVLDVLVDG